MTTWKYNNVLVKGEEKRRIIEIIQDFETSCEEQIEGFVQ